MGSQNGQIYLFPGLNRIPAPETNLERDPDRDLAYWSRPLANMGDTAGSSRGGGDFFTFSKNSAKNGKNSRGSAKTAAAAGRRVRAPFVTLTPAHFQAESGRSP